MTLTQCIRIYRKYPLLPFSFEIYFYQSKFYK